jgi:hypothetical protein
MSKRQDFHVYLLYNGRIPTLKDFKKNGYFTGVNTWVKAIMEERESLLAEFNL